MMVRRERGLLHSLFDSSKSSGKNGRAGGIPTPNPLLSQQMTVVDFVMVKASQFNFEPNVYAGTRDSASVLKAGALPTEIASP